MYDFGFVPFSEINITDGFWQYRQRLNADVSIPNVYKRFDETDRFKAIYPMWKAPFSKSHIFFDSDTAKWIEAAAYVLAKNRAEYPELERLCDDIIDRFAKRQAPNGYLNSFFQRYPLAPRFRARPLHELYCAGHIVEAAIAYDQATGKDKLLKVAKKYLDHIEKRFIIKQNTGFVTPGHEEIELALLKLFAYTGIEKYKKMAEHFVEKRGTVKERTYWNFNDNYDQHDKPVRELDSAEGHCVRAMYLYSAMADMARLNHDDELYVACERLFVDACKKSYVTGGIGSDFNGECFTSDYDLPNMTAYTESCAAIAFLMFCRRMQLIRNDIRYADMIERIMYNNLLSAVSLDGKAFFYENPLEIRQAELTRSNSVKKRPRFPSWERKEVFSCSCCPPNVNRQIASIADVCFTENEECLYLQQYISCEYAGIRVETNYPVDGKVRISATRIGKKLGIRIPSWCRDYSLVLNGTPLDLQSENGYIVFDAADEILIELELSMHPYYVYANPQCREDVGKVALMRGPVVYCMEAVDNGCLDDLAADMNGAFSECASDLFKLPVLTVKGCKSVDERPYSRDKFGFEPCDLVFIPYFGFANRGVSDMKVWIPHV